MSVAISWANKMQLAKCDIMVGFSISSHNCNINSCAGYLFVLSECVRIVNIRIVFPAH